MQSSPPSVPPPEEAPPRGAPGPRSIPPPGGPRRPWYLVVALLFAWVFGAAGFVGGCNDTMKLQQQHIDASEEIPPNGIGQPNETQRAAQLAAQEVYDEVVLSMTPRLFPLSVATFILGGALVLFTARAMAGRGSARSTVIQIALVQGILSIVSFAMTKHLREAQITLAIADTANSGAPQDAVDFWVPNLPVVFRVATVGVLVVRNVIAALIVVALTRTRTKEFFAAMDRRLSEP